MEIKRKRDSGKCYIFDIFRKKWVADTPEESVRQWFCHYLMESKGYPQLSISTETGLKLNGASRRCDTIVYKGVTPMVLIEFKSPDVTIDSSVMNQAISYNTKLKAPYIILTNSKTTYCVKFDFTAGTHVFLSEVPDFTTLLLTRLSP